MLEKEESRMFNLDAEILDSTSIAITGHIRPDGDCVGSTMALYNYIVDNFPNVTSVSVYLQNSIPSSFLMLKNTNKIKFMYDGLSFDRLFVLDCGNADRTGENAVLFEHAKRTLCIDHHELRDGVVFCDDRVIKPEESSASELLYSLMDKSKINKTIAECLYLGMVHDTGVFQYSCAHKSTMEAAGFLMELGIDFTEIVDSTFYRKTFTQNKLLGLALSKSEAFGDGKYVTSVLTLEDLHSLNGVSKDLEGIVNQLRLTKGCDVAIFLYELGDGEYKGSLRGNDDTDLNVVAGIYDGGGHKKAAGFSSKDAPEIIIENIIKAIKAQH